MNPVFRNTILLTVAFTLIFGCKKDEEVTAPSVMSVSPSNILLIIADDVGKDAIEGFSEGLVKPTTPNIDAIRTSGLRFDNFWSNPTCSPTRASIITGKYGYRTGVKWANDILAESETTIQEYIASNSSSQYATAIVGKWHLSGENPVINPESFGINYYAGILSGAVPSYYNWQLTEGGASSLSNVYATKKLTDLAMAWILDQNQPWFMWLAYNAPHTPFHAPPAGLHNQGPLSDYTEGDDPMPYYMAAIEAMDFQIGRLLDTIPESELQNTTIIFIGDNGTPPQVAQAPYSAGSAKGTLYQGGINVPLFVSGADVSRTGSDDNLITSSDLFATISQIAGVPDAEIHDSQSFKSLLATPGNHRNFQYAEMDDGSNDSWTISNGDYKLIEYLSGAQEFYNLSADPYEQTNLLDAALSAEAAVAKAGLEAELLIIRD